MYCLGLLAFDYTEAPLDQRYPILNTAVVLCLWLRLVWSSCFCDPPIPGTIFTGKVALAHVLERVQSTPAEHCTNLLNATKIWAVDNAISSINETSNFSLGLLSVLQRKCASLTLIRHHINVEQQNSFFGTVDKKFSRIRSNSFLTVAWNGITIRWHSEFRSGRESTCSFPKLCIVIFAIECLCHKIVSLSLTLDKKHCFRTVLGPDLLEFFLHEYWAFYCGALPITIYTFIYLLPQLV